jgi:glycosyltransferase involved in cell wall biosynthesis
VLRDVWEHFDLPQTLAKLQIDLYHGTDFIVPIPPAPFLKVATFHDAIAFTSYDDRSALTKARVRFLLSQSARAADVIVSVSDFSKGSIEQSIRNTGGKVHTIWNGVSESFYAPVQIDGVEECIAKARGNPGIILYYGGFRRHKNVGLLIDLFAAICQEYPHQLVLVGKRENIPSAIQNQIRQYDLEARVTYYGFAENDELRILLKHADVFVCPSSIEGFGLPVAEAIVLGTPVVCSATGSLPEVAGNAAIYPSSSDLGAWQVALRSVLSSPSNVASLKAACVQRAERFRWSRVSSELAELYARLVHDRKILI